jgi:hypothetical protein
LVGKPEGKRPLIRPRSRWEDNIRMDLREIGWDSISGSRRNADHYFVKNGYGAHSASYAVHTSLLFSRE